MPAPPEMLVELARLERDYYARLPDVDNPDQLVAFGTSGHRGSSLRGSFNEAHILGARSAPLAQFRDHIKTIPRDRVTILY